MSGNILYSIAFYAMAAVAVISAVMVVWHRQPVINAISLVLCLFAVAVAFVLLKAHFLAAIQVLLYAGAILVLFLMIIMLINQGPAQLGKARPGLIKAAGAAGSLALIVLLAVAVSGYRTIHLPAQSTPEELTLFLIERGWRPSEFQVKVPPLEPDEEFGPREEALVATDVLATLRDPMVKSFVEWPEPFDDMTEVLINDFSKGVLQSLRNIEEGQGLENIEVPPDLVQYFKDRTEARQKSIAFIEAAARGRLRQMEQFGATGTVGKVLFSRYVLAFEAASMLLLAAIVGVMVLIRRGPGEEG